MSVLKAYFDPSVNQCSPIQEDVMRTVQFDEDGNEQVAYLPVDYPSVQSAHGTVSDWSLDALLKAGINPNFPIHTGINTRIEGIDVVEDLKAYAESLVVEDSVESNK